MSRHFFPRLLRSPRRIFMRPWRRKLGAPLLVGGIVGSLLITYFGSGVCARYLGVIPGMLAASLLGSLFLLGVVFLIPPVEFSGGKTVRFRRPPFPPDAAGFREKILWRLPSGRELRLVLAGWIAVLTGSAAITNIWRAVLEILEIPFATEQSLVQLARMATPGDFVLLLLLTAGTVPLAEELIFRRCLPELLAPLGPRAALLLGSFIFAAAHGFLLGLPGLFFIGLIFQIVCNATRNLFCPILCHALLNGTVLLLVKLAAAFPGSW